MDNKLEKRLSQILEKLGGDTTLPENYNSPYFDKLEWWLSKIYEAEGEEGGGSDVTVTFED